VQSLAAEALSEHFSEGSIRGSVFNLCSATLGAGCLSLPYALTYAGIALGIAMLILGAAATIFSIHLLVLVRTRTNLNSYESVSRAIFGSAVGNFVEWCIILFCFGTAVCRFRFATFSDLSFPLIRIAQKQVAYCKTLRDFISPVLSLTTTRVTDREAICFIWLILLLPLSLIKTVNALRFSSLFGAMSLKFYIAVFFIPANI
jgi:amino acid permease